MSWKSWVGRLAVVALPVAACAAPIHVHSYTERGATLNRYHTYRFGPEDTTSTGDARLDGNPFFNERVRSAIDQQLSQRGLEKTRGGRADVLIHYHASVSQRVDLATSEPWDCERPTPTGGQPPPSTNCGPYVYDQGTLVIDFVDGRTQKVVWRGWAEGSIDGVLNDQKWMEERIDQSVKRILAQFPHAAD
jgi:hypothetical protein